MRLRNLNNITIVFFILIAFISLSGNFTANNYQLASDEVNQIRQRSLMYADILLAGSKFLTTSVRSYAVTGDPKYQQDYNDELYKTRSRDEAVKGLKSLGIPHEELALIEQAKLMSDTLTNLEMKAIDAVNQGDMKQALQLVYGPAYQHALQTIYEPINEFRKRLQLRTYQEASKARDQAEKKRLITNFVNVGSYIVVLIMMIFIYNRKIIKPIINLSESLQSILKGGSEYHIDYLNDNTEIGDLARSLEQYRLVTETMDAQNWIESNTGKVAALMQQSETQADLASNLLSFISPLLEVGHAALFVYDPLSKKLCLSGGYGCNPNINKTCFELGESLVGQCAQEQKIIILNDLPEDYIHIASALGDATPSHLCLLPILIQNRIQGVLELASFRPFNDKENGFLKELMATLALTMEVLSRNLQTQKLLAETQQQAQRMEKQAALLEEQAIEMEAQQAELKETESWYRSIIESAPQGMLISDENGTIILSNPRADALFGYGKGGLTGQNIDMLVPANLRSEYPLLRKKFLSSDGYQSIEPGLSITGVRKDGSEVAMEANLSLLSALGSHEKCIFISLKEINEHTANH